MSEPRDELAVRNSALTREDLLKRGPQRRSPWVFGALPERALGVYGPLRFQHKQLSGELKILQWSHFVPPYDPWLDGTYAKQWGEKNDVEVKIDHVVLALIPGAARPRSRPGAVTTWCSSRRRLRSSRGRSSR